MAIPTISSFSTAARTASRPATTSPNGATPNSTTCSSRRASIPDQGGRAKLYERMQDIEHDEAPEFLIAHSTVFEAMRANVTGYKQSPLGTHTFEGVDIQ